MPRCMSEIDDVECVKETEKALLLVIDGDEVWCPKSVIGDDSDIQGDGDTGRLVVQEWWAEKEGLV